MRWQLNLNDLKLKFEFIMVVFNIERVHYEFNQAILYIENLNVLVRNLIYNILLLWALIKVYKSYSY